MNPPTQKYDDGVLLIVDKTRTAEEIIAGTPIEKILKAVAENELAFADTRALTEEELKLLEITLKQKAREARTEAAELTQEDGIWFSNGSDPKYIAGLEFADSEFNKGIEFDESGNVLGRIDIAIRKIESARRSVGESIGETALTAMQQGGRFARRAGELGTFVGIYSAEFADESLTRFGRYLRDSAHGKTRLGRELFEISDALMDFRDRTAIPFFYREEHEAERIFIPVEESERILKSFYAWSRNSAFPWIRKKAGPQLANKLTRVYKTIRRDILRPAKKSMFDPLAEKIRDLARERVSRYYTPDPSTGKLVLRKEIELGYAHAARRSAPYFLGAISACTIGLIAYNSGTDFTKVNSRDRSAAVFRYEPSAEEKRFGANPSNVIEKFNDQYDECIENPLSVHDLRYANGNRVFRKGAKVHHNYRMKENQKGLYVKLSSGPCAPKRKR